MTIRTAAVGVACAAAILATGDIRAAVQVRGEGPVAVTLASLQHLGDRLYRLAQEGYRVDVVATPDAPFVPENVVVLLSEAEAGATLEYSVVEDSRLVAVSEGVSALADQGYVLRGFSAARARIGRGMGYVAVMERATPQTKPSREYRLILTRGTGQDWRVLERAGADGFSVIKTLSWPDATLSARSDVVFVCERVRGAGVPARLTLEWDARDVKLEEKVNARAAKGETLVAFWPSRMYLNALMSRPLSEPAGPARKYVIDSDPLGTPSMTSQGERLVNWVRYREDEQVGAYDTSVRSIYDIVSDELVDTDWNLTGSLRRDRQLFGADQRIACADRRRGALIDNWLPCEAWRLRDRLADRARRGQRPIDARFHRDERGRLTLDVILEQQPR